MIMMLVLTAIMFSAMGPDSSRGKRPQDGARKKPDRITLPAPRPDGPLALEQAIAERRSVREYTAEALTLEEISQLLWSAGGRTNREGRRAAPSAGALYPLELSVFADNVSGIEGGLYRYHATDHSLTIVRRGRLLRELSDAALGQACVRDAPAVILISAIPERTTVKYGARGIRYIHLEAGGAAQNLALQAVTLGLGGVTVGAFRDDEVGRIAGFGKGEEPLYLLPVGHPSRPQ